VAFGFIRDLAVMVAVPKTSMHENDLAPRIENQIGTSRQIAAMHSIAIAKPVHEAPNAQFRLRVFAFYSRHALTSLGFG
jgi:hypothetical protein